MPPAISVSGLVKTFGHVRALDGLDLEVATGEVHGFLGPNGAGKSTTIRVLLGMLRPDAGEVHLLGQDPWRDAVELHRRLAYVPGDVSLWPNLTGGEVIDLLGHLRGGLDPRRRDELLERFDLDPRKKAHTYSKGNRQKVALVAGLASDVELLSSHILAEVEALSDRVSIIRNGRTVESGTMAELRHLTRTSIAVETSEPITGLDAVAGIHDLVVEDHRASFDVDTAQLDQVVRHLSTLGVRSLTSQPPTLEELFLRHYGDELAERESVAIDAPGGDGKSGDQAEAAR